MPRKDPVVRLKPNTDAARPAWARKLSNGWHALRLKDKGTRVVIFVVHCAGKLAAFVPAETLGRGFEVPLSCRIDEWLAPLKEVVLMVFYFSDDVEVLRLKVHCLFKENASGFSLTKQSCHCDNANLLRRRTRNLLMMTRTQVTALIAHVTNGRISHSLTETNCLCAHLSTLTSRWPQGRQERTQQQMDLKTASSGGRETLVRPSTRTRHGRMITSCSPTTGIFLT